MVMELWKQCGHASVFARRAETLSKEACEGERWVLKFIAQLFHCLALYMTSILLCRLERLAKTRKPKFLSYQSIDESILELSDYIVQFTLHIDSGFWLGLVWKCYLSLIVCPQTN
jgi:hypothetical protein